MNNQKDTKKTDDNDYRQVDVRNNISLNNNDILGNDLFYDYINKKTEKILTALYLVSDCMDTNDAMKNKIRLLGVKLLSNVYSLSNVVSTERKKHISVSINHTKELLSFIEIAYTIGYISEMNNNILKNEFLNLISKMKSIFDNDQHFTYVIDKKMFEIPQNSDSDNDTSGVYSIKDNYKGQLNKRTLHKDMSVTNNDDFLNNITFKKDVHKAPTMSDKKERIDKIISIIKEKLTLPNSQDGVSIKDISLSFSECSEKTIQRELNSMVLKGQLKKTGSKRWSRYSTLEASLT